MIRIENVRRSYRDFSLQVDFAVDNSEIVSLLGSSGSGKTTTLRIIAGFETQDSGKILVNGEDISRMSPQQRRLGFVFQDYTLFPHLNVGQNVAYGLRAQKIPKSRHAGRVAELLELVGMEGFAGRTVQTLSGGEQQRIALARALAPQPRALLLDEPFSAVDTERREDLRRHVVRIQRELQIPVVFVTHSRSEALSISDRIVLLRNGAVVEQGRPPQLYLAPRSEYAARFLGRANFLPGNSPGERLLVRPEHLQISTVKDSEHTIAARVRESHYRGMYYEYDMMSDYGELGVVSEHEYSPRAEVWLGVVRGHRMDI
ncbi:MAG: ABC transporter ATP-binding protein [Spirochaeta sp.]